MNNVLPLRTIQIVKSLLKNPRFLYMFRIIIDSGWFNRSCHLFKIIWLINFCIRPHVSQFHLTLFTNYVIKELNTTLQSPMKCIQALYNLYIVQNSVHIRSWYCQQTKRISYFALQLTIVYHIHKTHIRIIN